MAREVLDVQAYPDLRQYPGGPPERPYDAAGWSLPLQMGVRVVAAAAPLAGDAAAKMKVIGGLPDTKVKPTKYEAALETDAAPFDSLPGAGFDTNSVGRHPAAGGPHHGIGSGPRHRSGTEQRVQSHQPRVAPGRHRAGERGTVRRADSIRHPRAVGKRAGQPREVARPAGGAN